jgi:hypothetical protein
LVPDLDAMAGHIEDELKVLVHAVVPDEPPAEPPAAKPARKAPKKTS